MTRKVKAVKAWAIVERDGTIADAGHPYAVYDSKTLATACASKVRGERVIPVRITPLTKKKGKANG